MSYDQELVHAVLDEALVCHVGFVVQGRPVVLPHVPTRLGEALYLHGSTGARARQAAPGDGLEVCLTMTLLDSVVLARSAFHHSVDHHQGRGLFLDQLHQGKVVLKPAGGRSLTMEVQQSLVNPARQVQPDRGHAVSSLARGATAFDVSAMLMRQVVSERLGHSQMSITADLYTHVNRGLGQAAAEQMTGALKPTSRAIPSAFLAQSPEISPQKGGEVGDQS